MFSFDLWAAELLLSPGTSLMALVLIYIDGSEKGTGRLTEVASTHSMDSHTCVECLERWELVTGAKKTRSPPSGYFLSGRGSRPRAETCPEEPAG